MAPADVIATRFRTKFGTAPEVIASAPGRVNLIGEHTDYNEGFVLPMAIDRRTTVAVARRRDGGSWGYAEATGELRALDDVRARGDARRHWTHYAGGMLRVLAGVGITLPPINVYIDAGVSLGAGLSSSAALEIALARAFVGIAGADWEPRGFARLAQQAEHDFVGVNCGIMDQLTSAAAVAGRALLIDCRSLEAEAVLVPALAAVVVMDTGIRRSLSGTDYNARRSVCDYAVGRVRTIAPSIRSLRDVDATTLESARVLLDEVAYRRARHVIEENARPALLARALERGDLDEAGALMDASHASLRDLFEVSSTHLDIICEEARAHPGCHGARMTGAGFGGCAIAIVDPDALDDFVARVQPRYEARTYQRSAFFRVLPDAGARLESG